MTEVPELEDTSTISAMMKLAIAGNENAVRVAKNLATLLSENPSFEAALAEYLDVFSVIRRPAKAE